MWVVLLALAGIGAAFGDRYSFVTYSVAEGLPQSQIISIHQDKKGFLWVGTLGGGVSRFDGVRFDTFSRSDGLGGDEVNAIAERGDGVLLFGTDRGAAVFDGRSFSPLDVGADLGGPAVKSILAEDSGLVWLGTGRGILRSTGANSPAISPVGFPQWSVEVAYRDRCGNLWFGGSSGSLARYDGKAVSEFGRKDGLPGSAIYSIAEDKGGRVWVGTQEGAYVTSACGASPTFSAAALYGQPVRALKLRSGGDLWLGTEGRGACRWNQGDLSCYSEAQGLSSNTVWALAEDREANLWIGTYHGGLKKFSGEAFRQITGLGLIDQDTVRAFHRDHRGALWIGAHRSGLVRLENGSSRRFTVADGLVDNFVLSIHEGANGDLWIATFGGVSRFDGSRFHNLTVRDGLPDKVVRTVYGDAQGRIWLGTNESGVGIFDGTRIKRLDKSGGLVDNHIWDIQGGRKGIWIGTGGGLNLAYEGKLSNAGAALNFPFRNVYSVLEDPTGNLWAADYGQGVVFCPADAVEAAISSRKIPAGTCSLLSRRDGLGSDAVTSLALDLEGGLWIGTERGVSRLDAREYVRSRKAQIYHYGVGDGFMGIECVHGAILCDHNGDVWLGTVAGAHKYSRRYRSANTVPPLIHILQVRLVHGQRNLDQYAEEFSGTTSPPMGLRLPHTENHLTFEYVGISFANPEKVQYQYMLKGFDREWSPPTQNRQVTYPNLPSGRYQFRARACNNDGVWSAEPAAYLFEIVAPFWRRAWFVLLVAALSLLALYGAVKRRVRGLERQRRLLETEVEGRTRDLADEKEKVETLNRDLERRVAVQTEQIRQQLQQEALLKDQLHHAQRLDSVGRLAGGMAHDLNNLLTVIEGFSALSLESLPPGSALHGNISEVQKAGSRAAQLTQQLLAFSRKQVLQPEVINVNSLVLDVENMLRRLIGENIELRTRLDGQIGMVMADPGQITQVLMNLAVNARDAVRERGTVVIETANLEVSETHAAPVAEMSWGAYVMLSVSDNGSGMGDDVKAHLFEPFFTTKERGRGTGLGLSTVYGIVKQSGGHISVYSENGHGSTFRIYLPRTGQEPPLRAAKKSSEVLPGSGVILLVEDQAEVRRFVVKALSQSGCTVLEAATPDQALRLSKNHTGTIDLLLTDVVMPGMGGIELAQQLLPTRPEMKVLYMSGYMIDGNSLDGPLAASAYISKPFRPAELMAKVREVLNFA